MPGEPERIEDQQEAAVLAGVTRPGGEDGTVTASGRCPVCRYLLTAPGHATACGTP